MSQSAMSEDPSWKHEETKHFLKVGLEMLSGSKPVWIAIQALSSGEALVIADTRCDGNPFQIHGTLIEEITHREYWSMLEQR